MAELFPDAPTQISLRDQIEAIEREIRIRRKVYPKWVAKKHMTQAKADFEIAAMQAALATLKSHAEALVRLPQGGRVRHDGRVA